jgi:hypothetical protein
VESLGSVVTELDAKVSSSVQREMEKLRETLMTAMPQAPTAPPVSPPSAPAVLEPAGIIPWWALVLGVLLALLVGAGAALGVVRTMRRSSQPQRRWDNLS